MQEVQVAQKSPSHIDWGLDALGFVMYSTASEIEVSAFG